MGGEVHAEEEFKCHVQSCCSCILYGGYVKSLQSPFTQLIPLCRLEERRVEEMLTFSGFLLGLLALPFFPSQLSLLSSSMPHHKHHSPRMRSAHSTFKQESKSHGSVTSSDSDTDSESRKSDDSLRRRSGKEESGSDSDTESASSSDEAEEKGKRKVSDS